MAGWAAVTGPLLEDCNGWCGWAKMAREVAITMPSDMHLHLRDDAVLHAVAKLSAEW